MEIRSLVGLTQLAEEVEAIADEIRGLTVIDIGVQIPDIPLPLSLKTTAEWLTAVDECRRRPRLARSKQLLEARGIETASIPAAVLESPEIITELLDRIDAFPIDIRPAAIVALGRALTKDFGDGKAVTDQFADAAAAIGDLEAEAREHPWIYKLAAELVANSPVDATDVVDQATDVLQHSNAAAHHGVNVGVFETLPGALQALSDFNSALAAWNQRLAGEGLPGAGDDIGGCDVLAATVILQQNRKELDDEKLSLIQQIKGLTSQLELLGGRFDADADTVAELRGVLPELQSALEKRRRALRQSLGKGVFQIVESLAKGELPAKTRVDDAKLGEALRKAVDSGYRISLEVPSEDQ
jgi:hypothetical protein